MPKSYFKILKKTVKYFIMKSIENSQQSTEIASKQIETLKDGGPGTSPLRIQHTILYSLVLTTTTYNPTGDLSCALLRALKRISRLN